MEKKIYSCVDVLKFVFSFFIIMIHVNIFSDVNESLYYFSANILTRIAVPFFFAASGFFFAKSFDYSKQKKISNTKSNFKRLRKTEWRIIVLYAVWSFIYFFVAIPFNYGGDWSFKNLVDYAIGSLIKYSFYHLWYVYALVFAYPILYMMMRFLSRKVITIVSVMMYVTGVFVNSYSHLFDNVAISTISEKIDSVAVSYLITNIVFRAVPLMWLGICVAQKRNKPNKIISLLISVAGFGLLVAENLLLNRMTDGVVTGNYILATLVVTYFLMMFAVQSRVKIKKETSARLRNMSTLIYCLHAMVILIFKEVVFPGINTIVLFVLTAIVTTAISAGIVFVSEKTKFRFLKYLY